MIDVTRELVTRALGGDRVALAELAEALLAATARRLPGLVARHRGRAGESSGPELEQLQYDLVEDLIYRYPNALRRWDPDAGLRFEPYIALFADGWLRRRLSTVRGSPWALRILGGATAVRGDTRAEEPVAALSLEDEVALRLSVAKAVETLTPDDRALLVQYYVEGRTTDDLARSMAVASNSVHQRLHRLRARLAAVLEPNRSPPPSRTAAARRAADG